MDKNLPIIKKTDRNISVVGFEFVGQEGKRNIGIMIQRSYKSKDTQEWVNETIKCFEDDLLKISNLCQQAYNDIISKRIPATHTTQGEKGDDIPF